MMRMRTQAHKAKAALPRPPGGTNSREWTRLAAGLATAGVELELGVSGGSPVTDPI